MKCGGMRAPAIITIVLLGYIFVHMAIPTTPVKVQTFLYIKLLFTPALHVLVASKLDQQGDIQHGMCACVGRWGGGGVVHPNIVLISHGPPPSRSIGSASPSY